MPKVPGFEWKKTIDPESEEYSPTMQEIEDERQLKESLDREIFDIESELAHPTEDPDMGEKNKFRATDPEFFWGRLMYLRIDFLDKVKDPELYKELEAKILGTEKKVYKQFIPFIESRIHIFGWLNSPLEEHPGGHALSAEDILSHFEQARFILKHFKVSEEEQIDFLSELDRLQEKVERYIAESTLFTFEKIEQELLKELHDIEYGVFYIKPKETFKGLGDEEVRKENQKRFDLLLAKAHSLIEIAGRMLNESIRMHCEARSKSLFQYSEYLKAKNDAPRELLTTEAELKDLLQRIKNGEKIKSETLDEIGSRLLVMKEKGLGFDYKKVIENLEKLLVRTQRAFVGEKVDEDDDRFQVEAIGVDWAWDLLGVDRSASKDDVRRAYRKLAQKYHPDISSIEGTAEKMKRINEAFELIKRAGDYK